MDVFGMPVYPPAASASNPISRASSPDTTYTTAGESGREIQVHAEIHEPPQQHPPGVEEQIAALVRQGADAEKLRQKLDMIMVMEEDEIRQDREEDAAPSRVSMASFRDPEPQPRRSARRGLGRSPSFSRSRERNPNRPYNIDPDERARYQPNSQPAPAYRQARQTGRGEPVTRFQSAMPTYPSFQQSQVSYANKGVAGSGMGGRDAKNYAPPQGESGSFTLATLEAALGNLLKSSPKITEQLCQNVTLSDRRGMEDTIEMVEAPTIFPDYRVLVELSRTQNTFYTNSWGAALKQKRFTGDPKNEKFAPNVIEYLHNMNTYQAEFPLSEDEFREHMQKNTSGAAWENIRSMRQNGRSTQQIYNGLLQLYDRREKPLVAIEKLDKFKLSDVKSWPELSFEVERLAKRASLNKKSAKQDGQRNAATHDGITYLLKILPKNVSKQVTKDISRWLRNTGQECTYSDVVAMCNDHQEDIEECIAEARIRDKKDKKGKGAAGSDNEVNAVTWAGPSNSGGLQPSTQPKPSNGGKGGESARRGHKKKPNKQGVKTAAQAPIFLPPPNVQPVNFQKEAENGRGYETGGTFRCRKCRFPNHDEKDCPYFSGKASQYVCKHCHLEAYHHGDHCLFRRHLTKRKAEEGPGGGNVPKN